MHVPTAHDVTAHDATALKPKAKPGPCALPPPNLQGAGKAHPGLRPAPMPTRQTRRMHRSHWRWRMPPRERGQRRRRRRQRQTQRPRPQQRLGLQGKGGRQGGRRVAKTSWPVALEWRAWRQGHRRGGAWRLPHPACRRRRRWHQRRRRRWTGAACGLGSLHGAEEDVVVGQPRWAWAGWAGCCCLQHFQSACQGCGNARQSAHEGAGRCRAASCSPALPGACQGCGNAGRPHRGRKTLLPGAARKLRLHAFWLGLAELRDPERGRREGWKGGERGEALVFVRARAVSCRHGGAVHQQTCVRPVLYPTDQHDSKRVWPVS